jgi:hypothetical protein
MKCWNPDLRAASFFSGDAFRELTPVPSDEERSRFNPREISRELRPHILYDGLREGIKWLWAGGGGFLIAGVFWLFGKIRNQLDYIGIGIVFLAGSTLAYFALRLGRRLPSTAPRAQGQGYSTLGLDAVRLADTEHQLLCLSHFERFALWQLLVKDGMTGEYFADLVEQYGIPVESLLGQQNLAKTFAVIQGKSALLAYNQNSERWTVRSEIKDFVHYVIAERLSPVFGI